MFDSIENYDFHYTEYPTRLFSLERGIQRFETLGVIKNFRKGFILAEPEEVPQCCYAVKKGRVIAFEFTPGGGERVYNFMEENSLLLEGNLLLNKKAMVYFRTTKPSELVCVEKEALLNGMMRDPLLMTDVLESLSSKFLAAMDQIREQNSHNVTWKFCNLMLIFAERFGVPHAGGCLVKEKISQQMLSNLLGINRVTCIRVINKLKESGLMDMTDGYYHIKSITALKRFAEGG